MASPAAPRRSSWTGADALAAAAGLSVLLLCGALAWTIVFVLRIGPVIGTIDARAGHGIHSGDLLALPLVGMGVLVCAATALHPRVPHRVRVR